MKSISKKRAQHLLSVLKDKIGYYSANYSIVLIYEPIFSLAALRVSAPNGFFGSCVLKDIYDFAEEHCRGYLSVSFSSKSNHVTIELN